MFLLFTPEAVRWNDGFGVDVDHMGFPLDSIDVLANVPKNTGWMIKTEITHAPRLIPQLRSPNSVLFKDTSFVDLLPPGAHIFDKDVHHEVFCKVLCTEILKQKAAVLEVEVGDTATFRGHRKTKILVGLLVKLEVL